MKLNKLCVLCQDETAFCSLKKTDIYNLTPLAPALTHDRKHTVATDDITSDAFKVSK